MAKNPADRYTTAADTAAAMREAVEPQTARRPRLVWSIAIMVLALTLLIAASALFGLGWPRNPSGPNYPVGESNEAHLGPVGGVGSPQETVPVPLAEEPHVKMWVMSERGCVCVTDPGSAWALPVADGNGIQLQAALSSEGYLYVLAFYQNRGADLIWPEQLDPESPPKGTEFHCPERTAEQDILVVGSKPGDEYGVEMFLFAVADQPLSAADLERLRNLPFQPNESIHREVFKQGAVMQFPMLPEKAVRSVDRQPEAEWALGAGFSKGILEMLDASKLRSWRGIVYPHQQYFESRR